MTAPEKLTRLHDWQMRLAALVAERQAMPFEWGRHDCALFCADAVEAVTGHDFAVDLRGTYSTALEAARVLQERGGVTAIATAALGDPVGPLFAAVGDVVLVDMNGREALGLCNGASVLGPGEDGLIGVGMGAVKAAWRVG